MTSETSAIALEKGSVALCDIINEKKQRTGDQIDVTIVDVRYNGDTPQSYRVFCKTERGTDKYIWVQAEFIHPKPLTVETDDMLTEL